MSQDRLKAIPNTVTPNNPVLFTEKCNGCNHCVEVCQVDVYIPNPEKGQSPVIMHPDECWYCGCCVNDCPNGGNTFNWPLQTKAYWKDKQSGKVTQM
jgi:NAD-dependent dihydropyrimidine dehydrogenase PreA subunit